MERIQKKMEEAKLQRKSLQESSLSTAESIKTEHNLRYIYVLGGVAAGLIIAVMAWILNSSIKNDNRGVVKSERVDLVDSTHLEMLSNNIVHLNEHVELLDKAIVTLSQSLTHMMPQNNTAYDSKKDDVIVDSKTTISAVKEMEKAFNPTHSVNARLNLRPSASLNSKPITVLEVGTKVEYIREDSDWYYVNTQSHGKGWCSSTYLSPSL